MRSSLVLLRFAPSAARGDGVGGDHRPGAERGKPLIGMSFASFTRIATSSSRCSATTPAFMFVRIFIAFSLSLGVGAELTVGSVTHSNASRSGLRSVMLSVP